MCNFWPTQLVCQSLPPPEMTMPHPEMETLKTIILENFDKGFSKSFLQAVYFLQKIKYGSNQKTR